MKTKTIVLSGLIAAMYATMTVVLAPISYGPLQFRVAELLKPLALFDPAFGLALAVGVGLANLASPFGPWDFVAMPLVNLVACGICWQLRRWPFIAVAAQAAIISAGVAFFPLGMVLQLPFLPTFGGVLVSELILLVVGYAIIWRNRIDLLRRWQ